MMEKEEYRDRRRNGRQENELTDQNEQEQEKAGFEIPEAESDPGTRGLPIKRGGAQVPRQKEARHELTPPERQSEPSAFDLPHSAESKEDPQSSRKQGRRVAPLVLGAVMLFAVTLFVVAALSSGAYLSGGEEETEADRVVDATAAGEEKIIYIRQHDGDSGLLTVPELYEACADTVVSIVTKREGATGVGSGMILTADGYIGTANHVVEGMTELTVVLADGTRHTARLIGGDAGTDLAVLKIDAEGLPTVSFGRSEELLFGERVVAIGTPASLDYAGSVCTGEISHPKRTVRIYEDSGILSKKMKVIQTDAPVNPGNSGCPLFDEYGRVIGVVTMKLGDRYDGIGFAIPADGALPIYEAMMAGEELTDSLLWQVSVPAPRLGIVGEAAQQDGLYGVRVRGFSSESAPAAFVLREGDLILQIDETSIGSAADITAALYDREPGQSVSVTVLRDGQRLCFEVTLGY